jgi:hypothetical protein
MTTQLLKVPIYNTVCRGYLAMQLFIIVLTDGGLFDIDMDYGYKKILHHCNQKLCENK